MSWIGRHSVLDAAGPQAAHIEWLWWLMFWVCTIVFVLVMGALAGALMRSRRRRENNRESDAAAPLSPETHRQMTRWVGGAIATTVLILFVLLVASVGTGRAVASLSAASAPVIKVTGHQWWWEVEYSDPKSADSVTTANEIHIPTGKPVLFQLASNDVIHSFWVPNLHGKRDLIPGHPSQIWLQADHPGVYRGFCAEFCGHQHAHMSLLVIAEPPAAFDAWYKAQLQPSVLPATPLRQRGRQVVESLPCALCHNIQGTQAGGKLGPDLTHLASRRTLAAGTLPNTPGNLAGWMLDPQTIKPGNHMPANSIPSKDIQAVLDYLGSLQ